MSGLCFVHCLSNQPNKIMEFYKFLAKLNKAVLPSMTKRRLDLAKAKKWQLALIGYRAFVTKKALG